MDDLDRAFGGMYRVKPIGFMNIIFSPLVLIGSLPNKCLGDGDCQTKSAGLYGLSSRMACL